jgi:hypothetical protein
MNNQTQEVEGIQAATTINNEESTTETTVLEKTL